MTTLLDGLLVVMLLTLAVSLLYGEGLYRSVILFIAHGLVMALIWVRLEAADIALAEAAIGAGLTGVLLLDALGRIHSRPSRAWRGRDDDGATGDTERPPS